MGFLSNLPRIPVQAGADLPDAISGTYYKASEIELHEQVEGGQNGATTILLLERPVLGGVRQSHHFTRYRILSSPMSSSRCLWGSFGGCLMALFPTACGSLPSADVLIASHKTLQDVDVVRSKCAGLAFL